MNTPGQMNTGQPSGTQPVKSRPRWRRELRLWRRWVRHPIREFKIMRGVARFNRAVERIPRDEP